MNFVELSIIVHNTWFLDRLTFYCAQAEAYVLIPDLKTLSYLFSDAFLLSASLILPKTHSFPENCWATSTVQPSGKNTETPHCTPSRGTCWISKSWLSTGLSNRLHSSQSSLTHTVPHIALQANVSTSVSKQKP